jgi:hypothetical protein
MEQDILEKFEFFPIKCRIQRALEVFRLIQNRRGKTPEFKYKTKVASEPHPSITLVPGHSFAFSSSFYL